MFTFFPLGYRGIDLFADFVLAPWAVHIGNMLYTGSGYVRLWDVRFYNYFSYFI